MQGWRSLVELARLASQGMGDCCPTPTAELLSGCCCWAAYGAGLRVLEDGEKEATEKKVPFSGPSRPH